MESKEKRKRMKLNSEGNLAPVWNLDLKIICQGCNEKPATVRRSQLCQRCYQRGINKNSIIDLMNNPEIEVPFKTQIFYQHKAEILFGQNHPTFIYQPATFDLRISKYTPDFYDPILNIFYEVIGSRQRFEQLRRKLIEFREKFPVIKLKVCRSNGEPYHSTKNPEIII